MNLPKLFTELKRRNVYHTHNSGLTQLVITPFFSDYRDDLRFVALCQKLGVQLPAN